METRPALMSAASPLVPLPALLLMTVRIPGTLLDQGVDQLDRAAGFAEAADHYRSRRRGCRGPRRPASSEPLVDHSWGCYTDAAARSWSLADLNRA